MTSSIPETRATQAVGPERLLHLKQRALMPCVYHFYKNPPQIVAGRGCVLIDHTGREYLDCYAGVTVFSKPSKTVVCWQARPESVAIS